jgi:hypothetical protein
LKVEELLLNSTALIEGNIALARNPVPAALINTRLLVLAIAHELVNGINSSNL